MLRLQILGPLRVWRDGVEVDPGPPQQAHLLALLLVRAGRPTSTSELIDLVWGDDVPATALNVIQKYVGALRRLLEPTLAARESGAFLRRRGSSYLFTADAGVLDLIAFRGLVEAARADGRGPAALDRYVEALALWRGPSGAGIAGRAVRAADFTAVDHEFYDACTAAAHLAVASGRPERVVTALQLAASSRNFTVAGRTAIEGLRLEATDGPFTAGTGAPVRGTTPALTMAMAGRAAYCDDLTGAGVPTLRGRCGG